LGVDRTPFLSWQLTGTVVSKEFHLASTILMAEAKQSNVVVPGNLLIYAALCSPAATAIKRLALDFSKKEWA